MHKNRGTATIRPRPDNRPIFLVQGDVWKGASAIGVVRRPRGCWRLNEDEQVQEVVSFPGSGHMVAVMMPPVKGSAWNYSLIHEALKDLHQTEHVLELQQGIITSLHDLNERDGNGKQLHVLPL